MSTASGSRWFVFADACYESDIVGLGALAFNEEGKLHTWFSLEMSKLESLQLNPEEKTNVIYKAEVLALVLGIRSLLPETGIDISSEIVAYTDNEAALSALISRKTNSIIVRASVNLLDEWELATGATVWYERVASTANPADAPSRGELADLDVSCRIPLSGDHVLKLLSAGLMSP